jgi:hypothetical protein
LEGKQNSNSEIATNEDVSIDLIDVLTVVTRT